MSRISNFEAQALHSIQVILDQFPYPNSYGVKWTDDTWGEVNCGILGKKVS